MVRSRRLDDKEIQLKNQSRAFFQISGAGHEAVLVAAGLTLKPGYDWFHRLLSRSRAVPAARRDAARDAARVGRRGGRSEQRRTPDAVALGAQARSTSCRDRAPPPPRCCMPSAAAEAGVIYERVEAIPIANRDSRATRSSTRRSAKARPARASSGSRSTPPAPAPAGPLSSSKTTATRFRCPVEVQTPGGDVSRLLTSFPGLHVASVDGTDFFASLRVMREAVAYVRARKGPAVVHARVIRPYSHSLSDDEKLYKTPQEREAEARRDPITRFAEFLRHNGLATAAEIEAINGEVAARSRRSRDRSLESAPARPGTRRPSSSSRRTWIQPPMPFSTAAEPEGKPDTMVAAINRTLKDEMAHDPRIVVFGEDVADASRREALKLVARQGRRLQGHARAAARVRRRPRVQRADCRSQHHRPGGRHGDSRAEAGRRDPVLRLHLAGDDAAAQRDGDAALPERQPLVVPDGRPRPDRRLPSRRRAISQPVRRKHLRALPGHPHRVSRRTPPTPPACCARPSGATIR